MQTTEFGTRLSEGLPERVAARLQVYLASAPDAGAAIHFLDCLRQDSASAFGRICSSPAALRCAINLFSHSNFLSKSVLKSPERILQVANSGSLYRVLTAEEYEFRLFDFLGDGREGIPAAVDLARFRRRQLLRILLRDVLGFATLSSITEELSNLADAILDVAYRGIRGELVVLHGEPRLRDGRVCGFSVISLGKLGGKELNYSS